MRISNVARHGTLVAIGALCAASMPAADAHADPGEELIQVAHHPTDPDTMLMRYRNGGSGLVLSDDGGKSLQLIPGSFIDEMGNYEGAVAGVAADGSLWLGTLNGTLRGDPGGCDWQYDEQIGERFLRDFAHDPREPELLYAVTGDTEALSNGLIVRDAAGTWSELGVHEALLPYAMRVAPIDDGLRFVVTARRDEHGEAEDGTPTLTTSFVLRISEDRGESWEELAFDDEFPTWIVAIDPTDIDRMVFFVDDLRGGDDRYLITRDGGRTIEPWLTVTSGTGVTFLADGRVLAGDRGDLMSSATPRGLWSAPSLDEEPELLGDWQVRCLDYQAATDTLFGCELRGYGTIDLGTGMFTPVGRLTETRSVSCPGVDVLARSRVQLCLGFCLNHFPLSPVCVPIQEPTCGPCFEYPSSPECTLYGAPPDAGSPDAGSVDDAGALGAGSDAGETVDASDDDCSCSTPGRSRQPGTAGSLVSVLALAAAARRVHRRRPR